MYECNKLTCYNMVKLPFAYYYVSGCKIVTETRVTGTRPSGPGPGYEKRVPVTFFFP